MNGKTDKRRGNEGQINVLFLFSKLVIGGAERTLIDLVPRLDRSRVNPLVVCLKEKAAFGEEMERRGVPVIAGLSRHRFDFTVLFKLIRIVRKHKIRGIYTLDHDDAMFWGKLLTLYCRFAVSLTVIHTTVRRNGKDSVNFLGEMLMPLTDKLIATAYGSQQYLIAQGIHPRKIELIYNGVDIEALTAGRQSTKLSKADFGIPEHARIVAIVAAFKPEKAHHIFLQAAKKIIARRDDVYFMLIGDGPQRANIERHIAEMQLQDRVQITGFREDIVDIYPLLDISALSSDPRVETFSLTILESLAAGLPAVVTDVGSMDEMVFNGINGYCVPPRNPDVLAESMLKILNDDALHRKMSENSRRIALERFQVDRMVQETEDLILRIKHDKETRKSQIEAVAD